MLNPFMILETWTVCEHEQFFISCLKQGLEGLSLHAGPDLETL